MGWLTRTAQTSIGKKSIMAVSGFLLGLFLIIHLVGNLTTFGGRQAFLDYSESLHSMGPLVSIFEVCLLLVFLTHIISAIIIYFDNLRARPVRYAVNNNAGDRSWGSMTMPYTGLLILCFLFVHLYNFHFNGQDLPVADLVRNTLNQPGYAFFYIVAVLGVSLHISHGLWSMFQSLGLNHPRYNCIIRSGALLVSVIVGTVFVFIPLLTYFYKQFLLY